MNNNADIDWGRVEGELLSFTYFSLLFTLSLLLQNILGYTVLYTGYLLLLLTMILGVLSIPAGKLVDKVGVKIPLILGTVSLITSCIILAVLHIFQSPILVLVSLVLLGFSFALTIPASATAAI